MLPEDPLAASRRRRIVVTVVVTVLLLGGVLTKLVSMQVAQVLGERAWRSGDVATAQRHFAVTGRLNVVQRWIAPFNRGVAASSNRDWDDAVGWFEEAMGLAPDSARCRIALNWTWTLEAAADEHTAAGDRTGAVNRLTAARAVLGQAVGCDEGKSGKQPEQPESQSEPQASGPQPGDQPSEDPENGPGGESDEKPGDGAPGDGKGKSEQGQADQTEQRVDQKLSGSGKPRPQPQQQASDNQAERLSERNRSGARARQQAEDQQPSEGRVDAPRHTW